MKKHFLSLVLFSAMLLATLGIGLVSTSGTAHAASQGGGFYTIIVGHVETPSQQHPNLHLPLVCNSGEVELDEIFNQQQIAHCNSTFGTTRPNFHNIYQLSTGNFNVTWNWFGCDGSSHQTTKPPHFIQTSDNAPNGFAGCQFMEAVPIVTLS